MRIIDIEIEIMALKERKFKEVDKVLKKNGFVVVSANKHVKYVKGSESVTVPNHKVIHPFTVKDIERTTGLKF